MSNSRTATWAGWIFAAGGLLLLVIPALWVFMRTTATTLHPRPEEAPSITRTAPPAQWSGAVELGRRAVRASLVKQNLPGLSVAVGVDGEIVWAEGFGFADLDSRLPVTPNHRFRIGTASKVLTSAAVGVLLEEDRLKLDDVIQTYVPEFPQKQWPVTLRQLMGNLAGVKNDGGDEGPLYTRHCGRPVEALPHFAASPLRFEPGTQFRHSSYGWILVSAAVEAAAEKPFQTFMRERVFDALGMRDTLAEQAGRAVPDVVTFYFPRFAADPTYGLHLMRDLDYSCYAGAGGFLTTPSDLVRFAMAMNSGKLLRPATVQLLQTSQRLVSGKDTGYGLGWDIKQVTIAGKPARAAGHDGETLGGMAASLMTIPERGLAVAVTSNISYADTFALAEKIAQGFGKRTAPQPVP